LVEQQIDRDGGNVGKMQINRRRLRPAFPGAKAVTAGGDPEVVRNAAAEIKGGPARRRWRRLRMRWPGADQTYPSDLGPAPVNRSRSRRDRRVSVVHTLIFIIACR
jgi:hypothetical protein